MKYRKKPIVIEAIQWDATVPTGERIREWSGHYARHHDGSICFVDTPEGTREARPGDWIIKDAKGEFSLCKPAIFEATHEAVDGVISQVIA